MERVTSGIGPVSSVASETESEESTTDSHSFSSTENTATVLGEVDKDKRVRFFGDEQYNSSAGTTPGFGPEVDEILVSNPTRARIRAPARTRKPPKNSSAIGTSVDTTSDSDTDSDAEHESVPLNTGKVVPLSSAKNPGQPQRGSDILLNVEDRGKNNNRDKKKRRPKFLSIMAQKLPWRSGARNQTQTQTQTTTQPEEKVREMPVDVGNLEEGQPEPEAEADEFSHRRSRNRKKSYDAALTNPQNDDDNPDTVSSTLLCSSPVKPDSRDNDKSDASNVSDSKSKTRKSLSWSDILMNVGIGVGKTILLLFLLYMFVCSLDLLSLGFRLIGGKTAGEIFRKSEILQNPVVGLMIGILTTVLVQSSSTSTSIIVGMVAANFLSVQVAIPIIMGSNIGTSITNTLVAVGQAGDRDQFRRAFAGATLLDMFNWITVIVLLPLEITTGYLYHFSSAIMRGLMPDKQCGGDFQLLSVLTKPFVNLIVQLDRNVLECWSNPNCTHLENSSLIREFCSSRRVRVALSQSVMDPMGRPILEPITSMSISDTPIKCDFIFSGTSLSDAAAGAIILVLSLLVLCSCLVLIVKVLSSVLQGHAATVIQKTLNADIPYVPWLTGYIAILVGAVFTFLVQSSSVFTSAITPLIGLGMISVERAYPLTLGSNIGTTTTAVIASMAVEGNAFFPSMQIALCHALFNISGILIFYPIPFLRFPVPMAKFLGKTTAKFRWFALVYMVAMFALFPAITISLSFGGPIPVIVFCLVICAILLFILILTVIQRKRPSVLPVRLRTWKFLPLPLRSLQPYDDFFTRFNFCSKFGKKGDDQKQVEASSKKEKKNGKVKNSNNSNNNVIEIENDQSQNQVDQVRDDTKIPIGSNSNNGLENPHHINQNMKPVSHSPEDEV